MTKVGPALLVAVLVAGAVTPGGCTRKKAQGVRMAEAGPEDWVVDGAPYHISSSHYERGPGNVVVYVMTYPGPAGTSATTVDKDGAGNLVWPLVKYAYNNRTFERARIPPVDGTTPPSVTLAVDLLSSDGHFLFRHEVPAGK